MTLYFSIRRLGNAWMERDSTHYVHCEQHGHNNNDNFALDLAIIPEAKLKDMSVGEVYGTGIGRRELPLNWIAA